MDHSPSKQLRYFWNKSHLTQIEAAQIMGITQPAVNHYLNDKIPLNTNIIIQFADLLGINPQQIDPDIFKPKHHKE